MMSGASSATDPLEQPWRVPDAPDVLSLYWVQNVGIVAWHKPASGPAVQAICDLVLKKRADFPKGISFVHIGRAQFSVVDTATRDVFVHVLRELKGYVGVTAVVGLPNGFLASAARSVVTSLLALSRSSTTIRFHESALELLDWFPAEHQQSTGVELDVALLRRVLLLAEARSHELAQQR